MAKRTCRRAWSHLVAIAVVFCWSAASATANPILGLSFNNTLQGAAGELPAVATGVTFVPGVAGSAAFFPTGSDLTYASSGNIVASGGTLEFFLTPGWNGNDGLTHTFLTWGSGGGMTFEKDGGNNLRGIFRRYGIGGPETSAFASAFNVSGWRAGETHYLAYTWDDVSKVLSFYLNGQLQRTNTFTGSLPAITATTFQLGGDNGPGNLQGSLDELQIHDNVLSASQIAQRYAAVTAATVPEPSSLLVLGVVAGVSLGWRRVQSGPRRRA